MFKTPDGCVWQVFQVAPSPSLPQPMHEALADGWLCFLTAEGQRLRLMPPPPGWEELDGEELVVLLGRAVSVPDLPGSPSAQDAP
jgi:hypothetical protein